MQEILNDKGQKVVLNEQEKARSLRLQKEILNATGYEIDVTTMTGFYKSIVQQKVYGVVVPDYVPLVVGNGAFGTSLTTYRSFNASPDFESGLMNGGTGNVRSPEADIALDSLTVPIKNWKADLAWNLFELAQAQKNNTLIDVLSAKEKSRKMMWDLGIQKIAFLGSKSDTNIRGLLNQSDVNANTSVITKKISSMSDTEFQTLVSTLLEAYHANGQRTVYPDTFIIPTSDWNGLATPVNTNFAASGSKGEYLLKSFQQVTNNPNFKMLPLAYADVAQNVDAVGLNKTRYTLFNKDEETVRMDIPVPYTNTTRNTQDGFNFRSVAYGQFTGVKAYRPLEMLYFDF